MGFLIKCIPVLLLYQNVMTNLIFVIFLWVFLDKNPINFLTKISFPFFWIKISLSGIFSFHKHYIWSFVRPTPGYKAKNHLLTEMRYWGKIINKFSKMEPYLEPHHSPYTDYRTDYLTMVLFGCPPGLPCNIHLWLIQDKMYCSIQKRKVIEFITIPNKHGEKITCSVCF